MMKNCSKEQHLCDEEVKKVFRNFSHRKCTCAKARMYCVEVTGAALNNYLRNHRHSVTDPKRFNPHKKFNICRNLHASLSRANNKEESTPAFIVPTVAPTGNKSSHRKSSYSQREARTSKPSTTHKSVVHNNINDRAQRLFHRTRLSCDDVTLKGVKKVTVKVGEEMSEIDLRAKRLLQKFHFTKSVLKEFYRVPFGRLSMRQRRLRMAEIGKGVLGSCVDRKAFKKDSDGYLYKNKQLAIEIINLLDGVKEYIATKLHINFDSLNDVAVVPIGEDRDGGLITTLNNKKREHQLAISLLGEMSANGFERVRKNLEDFTSLPSYYDLKKGRPKVVPIVYKKMDTFDSVVDDGSGDDGNGDVMLDMDEMNRVPEEYELEMLVRRLANEEQLDAAKIDGDYQRYIELLEKKHVEQGRKIEGNVAVIDSFDGAEHLRSKKSITSVISFSTSLLCPSWINSRTVTAGSSLNLLTWQQMRGTETIYTMKPAVESYYASKKVLREQAESRNTYWYYDLHDGKMLYLLTQHSQWSRKNSPFLLCRCNRGEGVINNANHVCKKILHSEQQRLYARSKRRWEYKRNQGPDYSVKNHMDWVDIQNDGVSHFGIEPDLLPRDSLRFDTFHMKCAVTRKIMGYTRRFFMNQSSEVMDDFCTKVLRTFWKDYHLYVWKNKKNFASFLGNEIALFVGNTNAIIRFMDDNLESTVEVDSMKEALQLWLKLFKFLGLTYITNEDEYKNDLLQFELNLKRFYTVGARTFLSSQQMIVDGREESFYCHALRYYMIEIAKVTFERHRVGIGIFNMQGFERRNKESKNCIRRFSNKRGNVLPNNLRRIWDVFEHDINAI